MPSEKFMKFGKRDAFSAAEIAARLDCTAETWCQLVESGHAPRPDLVLGPDVSRWSRGCLDRYLAEVASRKTGT